MTINKHLLIKIAEECNEVAQRCQKALCYGENQIQEGQALDNVQRIKYEWNDLLAMIEIANERGMDISLDRTAIELKKGKYYIELGKSIVLGKVQRDPLTREQKSKLLEGDWRSGGDLPNGDKVINVCDWVDTKIGSSEASFKDHFESIDPKNYIPDHSNLISKTDKDRIIVLKGMLKELPATLTDENMVKMSEIGEEIRKIGRKYEML